MPTRQPQRGSTIEPQLATFPLTTHDKLRYNDTDRQGHVNNAVFATFFETGRVDVFYRDPDLIPEGHAFVLARLVIDYRREVLWPGTVEIGSGIRRIGTSSVGLEQAVFQKGRCCAVSETVGVLTNVETRRSAPLPAATAEKLRGYLLAEAD